MGRDEDMQLLLRHARDAFFAGGRITYLTGPPGSGKSRLIAEWGRRLIEDGHRLAVAKCTRRGGVPFGPIDALLRELDAADPTVLADVPLVRAAFDPEREGKLADSFAGKIALTRIALERFAHGAGAALVIDDLQWADRATLDTLAALSEDLPRLRIHIVAATRIGRRAEPGVLALHPLSDGTIAALLETWSGDARSVAPRILAEININVEGNPLFAHELLLAAMGASSGDALPISLFAALQSRAARGGDEVLALLEVMAIAGAPQSVDVLSRAAGTHRTTAIDLLRRAEELQLAVQDDAGNWRLKHDLLGIALSAPMSAGRQQALHARIATSLALDGDEALFASAYHWHAADDRERAATCGGRAADRARALSAHGDAIGFCRQALAHHPELPAEAVLHAKLGAAYSEANEHREAIRHFRRALSHYQTSGDLERQAELSLLIAWRYWSLSDLERALAWRLRALEAVRLNLGSKQRARAIDEIAEHFLLRGQPDAAKPFVSFGAPSGIMPTGNAAASRNPIAVIRARRQFARAALENGDITTALQAAAHAVAGASTGLFVWELLAGNALLAMAQFLRGDYHAARTTIEAATPFLRHVESGLLELRFAAVAIPLGIALADSDLLRRFAREDLLARAQSSGDLRDVVLGSAAFAAYFAHCGNHVRATAVADAVADAQASACGSAWTYPEIASHASEAALERARPALERWAAPAENPLGKALLQLFDGIVAIRRGELSPDLEVARTTFAAFGCRGYEALAFEVEGRWNEANAIYRELGNSAALARIEARLQRNRVGRAPAELTQREREVEALLRRCSSNKEIAVLLNVSERTAESHVASILRKLGLRSRAELVT
jgi:DNA-binding CsgD family transcriptional regulator/tetratricopeptide (TPR) repeat protein